MTPCSHSGNLTHLVSKSVNADEAFRRWSTWARLRVVDATMLAGRNMSIECSLKWQNEFKATLDKANHDK